MHKENIESVNPVGKEVVDTITNKKKFIKKVKIHYSNWWQNLFSLLFILPRFKKIYLTDPYPGTVYRLLGALIDLKVQKDEGDTEELGIYKIIKSNIPILIEFTAFGLHNKETLPPRWLFEALNNQFSTQEIEDLTYDIYRRLDVQTFFGITVSLRNVQDLNLTLDPEALGDL